MNTYNAFQHHNFGSISLDPAQGDQRVVAEKAKLLGVDLAPFEHILWHVLVFPFALSAGLVAGAVELRIIFAFVLPWMWVIKWNNWWQYFQVAGIRNKAYWRLRSKIRRISPDLASALGAGAPMAIPAPCPGPALSATDAANDAQLPEEPLTKEEESFLDFVVANPNTPVGRVYSRLGTGWANGSEIRDALQARGLIEVRETNSGKMLRPTNVGTSHAKSKDL